MIIQDTLSPEWHTSQLFGSTKRMLTNIRVTFQCMDKNMMENIVASMIRPRLECTAAVVWSLNFKKDIKKLERFQRAATIMVLELKDLAYEDRLKEMCVPTLQDR